MRVGVTFYGSARVVIGRPRVEVSLASSTVTLGQVLEQLIATYPRARPYLLDEAGSLPSFLQVLINAVRPVPDATPATVLHDEDQVTLLVAVAGGEQRIPALPAIAPWLPGAGVLRWSGSPAGPGPCLVGAGSPPFLRPRGICDTLQIPTPE